MESLLVKNREDMIKYLDLTTLSLPVIQRRLVEPADTDNWGDNLKKVRTKFVDEMICGDHHVQVGFVECIKKASDHLGHQYITSRLESKEFKHEDKVPLSTRYRDRIIAHMPDMKDLDIESLTPHMRSHELLTDDEITDLEKEGRTRRITKLFSFLDRKGPTAHFLFVKCLKVVLAHPQHKEIYKTICNDSDVDSPPPSPKRKRPHHLEIQEPLTGTVYHKRRLQFEEYYHNGQWDLVESLARECFNDPQIEIQVIGHTESALSWIFRNDDGKVCHHVRKARELCKRIPNHSNNRRFLEGRCEYLLALHYLYLDKPVLAQKHVHEAKQILCFVEIGEDKSFACYVDAKIAFSMLDEDDSDTLPSSAKCTVHSLEEVIQLYNMAVAYATHSEHLDTLVIYSLLRLSELHLSLSNDIASSRSCLEELKSKYYDKMGLRCQSIYSLAMSDLHRRCNDMAMALESAQLAKLYAQNGGYTMEIEKASNAITSLESVTA